MPAYEEDFREAARLEAQGDAAAASRQQAAGFYRAAQNRLMPCGRIWTHRDEYERHMAAFERLQEKLYELDQHGLLRGGDAPSETGDPSEAVREPEPNPDDAWLELALQRRFEEAAHLLEPRASGLVGMGYYASRGRGVPEQRSLGRPHILCGSSGELPPVLAVSSPRRQPGGGSRPCGTGAPKAGKTGEVIRRRPATDILNAPLNIKE